MSYWPPGDDPEDTTLPAVDDFVARARDVVQEMDVLVDDLKALLEELEP